MHDPKYDEQALQISLNDPGQYSVSSPNYTLTAYPNDELLEMYETGNPTIATVGSVCIILFTSVIFFLYDFFVRSEIQHKDSLFKARRQFVRFVSHEVRRLFLQNC